MRIAKVSALPRQTDIKMGDIFYTSHKMGAVYESRGLEMQTFIDWLTSEFLQMDSITIKIWNDQLLKNDGEKYGFVLQLSEDGRDFPSRYTFIFPKHGEETSPEFKKTNTSAKWDIIDFDNCKVFNGKTWEKVGEVLDGKHLNKEMNIRFSEEYKRFLNKDETNGKLIPLRYMRYTFVRESDFTKKVAFDKLSFTSINTDYADTIKWESAVYTGISKGYPLKFNQYLSDLMENNPTYNQTTTTLSDIIGSASI